MSTTRIFLLGRPAYFDITIRNSFQPSYVVHSAHCAGAAAVAGEIEKDDRLYGQRGSSRWSLLPSGCLSRTVLGPPIACKILKLLQDDLLFGAVSLLAELFVNLHGRLSLGLWQYNARMVLDRLSLLGLDGDSLLSSCDW